MTQWMPQTTDNFRPAPSIGEIATIGHFGRSRETRSPVEPEQVQHTMAAKIERLGDLPRRRRDGVGAGCLRRGVQHMQRRQIGGVVFHFLGDAVHGRHRFDRVLARRQFRRQHDGVGAVENGGGDVGDFGARRHRARDHRFQHLRGDDDRLAGAAAGARHFLLHAGDFFQRHFDAEIAARDHQRVGKFEDVGEPRYGLRLLDLGHHRGAAARKFLRFGDILGALNERQRDPIDAGIERGFEIGDILRRQRRQRHDGVGQADALAVRYFAADLDLRDDALRATSVATRRSLPSSMSSASPGLMAAKISGCGSCTRLASPGAGSASSDEILALVDLGRAVLENAPSRSFGPCRSTRMPIGRLILGFDLADGRHQFAHALVIGVAHIDAEDVGAGLEQPADDGAIARCRAQRGDDFGAPLPSHCVLALPVQCVAAGGMTRAGAGGELRRTGDDDSRSRGERPDGDS